MSEATETLVDSILLRLRDPNARAHPRELVRDIVSRVQVDVNALRSYVLADYMLRTTPGKAIYRMDSDIQGLVKVTEVQRSSHYIDEITPWRNLWKLSPTWRTDAGQTQGWAMIGMTLFAVWPTPTTQELYVVRGPALTPDLVSDALSTPFRAEDQDIVKDLATALLLLRWRDMDTMQMMVDRAGNRMLEQIATVVMDEHR